MRTVDGLQKTWIPHFDADRVPAVLEREQASAPMDISTTLPTPSESVGRSGPSGSTPATAVNPDTEVPTSQADAVIADASAATINASVEVGDRLVVGLSLAIPKDADDTPSGSTPASVVHEAGGSAPSGSTPAGAGASRTVDEELATELHDVDCVECIRNEYGSNPPQPGQLY